MLVQSVSAAVTERLRRVKDTTVGLWPHTHMRKSAGEEPTRETSFPQSAHPWRRLSATRTLLRAYSLPLQGVVT